MKRYSIQFKGEMGSELDTDSRAYALRVARKMSHSGIVTVHDNRLGKETESVSYLDGVRLGNLPERAPVSI